MVITSCLLDSRAKCLINASGYLLPSPASPEVLSSPCPCPPLSFSADLPKSPPTSQPLAPSSYLASLSLYSSSIIKPQEADFVGSFLPYLEQNVPPATQKLQA